MRRSLILLTSLLTTVAVADDAYLLGVSLQADDEDGFGVTAFGSIDFAEKTTLSAALGRSTVDLTSDERTGTDGSDSLYADLGLDHRFGMLGVGVGASYWGDSDLLDSRDLRGSVYLSGEMGSIGLTVEERDFEFQLPPFDFLQRTSFPFDASGVGINARLKISDAVDVYASHKSYDYSVDFSPLESDRIRPIIVISRLSVLSSLADTQTSFGVGINVGEQEIGLNVTTWDGAITGSRNDSYSVSFLTPISLRVDMEIELGTDRSDVYGDVTVASLRFYYYGGME